MVEGARLERVYRVKPIEGSNPSLSAIFKKLRKINVEPLVCDYFRSHRILWRF